MDIRTIQMQLQSVAERRKEIAAIYAFGSVLTKEHPEDIDIAVLLKKQHIDSNTYLLDFMGSLTPELQDALKTDNVDLLLLNTASPIICMQVLRKGKLLCERDRRAVILFTTSVFGRYCDLKMVRKPIEQNILRGRIYG